MKTANVRLLAAQTLSDVLAGQSLARTLPHYLPRAAANDKALLQQLCYGALRHYPQLDGILNQCLQKKLKRKDDDVRQLLIVGIYQLLHTRIPDHASISTTVAACAVIKKPWAKGLINAVLRRVQREGETLIAQLTPAQSACTPPWLFKKIQSDWPKQSGVFTAMNTAPPMTLRVNQLQHTRDSYSALLKELNIAHQLGELTATAIRLDTALNVDQLPGFNTGSCSVQDEAAQICADLVLANSPTLVLDACCAPGGKTGHLLEASEQIELDALEIDSKRMLRVEENLERLNLNANLIVASAAEPLDKNYDAILLDAPCSATGVIRRNPDVKVLRKFEDIAKLAEQQSDILKALWDSVKPGGRLVYVTCSIMPEENWMVVNQFLQQQSDAYEVPINATWGHAQKIGRQLLPGDNHADGFYFAVLAKRVNAE